VADPAAQVYDPSVAPFKGAITLFPDRAESVDVSSADATFAQARTIFVGGAGVVTVRPFASNADVAFSVPEGGVVPVRVAAVRQVGTTASDLVSVW
jgi:hypothetical protein